MNASGIIHNAIRQNGMTNKAIAEQIGMSQSLFNQKIQMDTFSMREFFDILTVLNMVMFAVDKELAEQMADAKINIRIPDADAPRVSMRVRGLLYDTAKAKMLFHAGLADGVVMGIYKGQEGCFIVVMVEHSAKPAAVFPVDEAYAMAVIREYDLMEGGDIEQLPVEK